jgi:hypothetical protein
LDAPRDETDPLCVTANPRHCSLDEETTAARRCRSRQAPPPVEIAKGRASGKAQMRPRTAAWPVGPDRQQTGLARNEQFRNRIRSVR